MSEQLKVSSSPHIRSKETTGNIMLWVIIALLPATFFGIYNFRDTHAWLLVIVTTAAAVLTEYIYEKLMHKKITIKDFSAAVTGLLLALNLPVKEIRRKHLAPSAGFMKFCPNPPKSCFTKN